MGSVMEYPLVYEDEFGTVETACISDGHGFVFELRGWTFRGQAFDCLWVDGAEMADLPPDLFPVDNHGDLVGRFTITLPLGVLGAADSAGQMVLSFDYREGAVVEGTLTVDGAKYAQVSGGWGAEGNLIGLQHQLPSGVFLACCLSCRWAHFNPYGADDIGSLGCFVDWPGAATVSDKQDVSQAWQDEGQFQYVQETWRCPRFRLIQLDEWAYKDWDYFVYQKDGRVPAGGALGQ